MQLLLWIERRERGGRLLVVQVDLELKLGRPPQVVAVVVVVVVCAGR